MQRQAGLLSELDEARLDAKKLPQPGMHAPITSFPLLPGSE